MSELEDWSEIITQNITQGNKTTENTRKVKNHKKKELKGHIYLFNWRPKKEKKNSIEVISKGITAKDFLVTMKEQSTVHDT